MGAEMVRAPSLGTLEPTTMDEAARLATTAAASGLFAVKRPEEALVILLTGRELGLSAMAALRGIYVVSGRPVLSADLLVACVRRSGLCRSWRVVESTPARCEITTQRVDEEHPASKVWTSEDAKRAGLSGRGTWAAYPAQMLRHRCAADLAREVYPEVAMGLYDPEELEAVPARDPRQVPTLPAPPPAPEDESGAVRRFVDALDLGDVPLAAIPGLWHDVQDGLRAEGRHPEDHTDHLAKVLDAWLDARGYYTLSAADRTALMGGVMPADLARWHDALSHLDAEGDTVRLAAETWLASRWSSLDAEASKPYRLALSRWLAAALGAPEDTRGAGVKLGAAVKALRDQRAAAVDAASAPPGRQIGDDEGGDDSEPPPASTPPRTRRRKATDATSAPAEDVSWQTSREGMEAHAASLSHARAIEASAARHRTLVGYAAVLAARLVALTPPDEHGAMLSAESARARVNGWMAQAQAQARRAA